MEKKNSCALAVVATARCKAQSTSLYIHQTILCLTSPINWQLKGLATSALILISHPLPSQAMFLPHKAFHRAVHQTAYKVSLKLFKFWQCELSAKAFKAFIIVFLPGSS